MKWFLLLFVFLSVTSCKYKEYKATYSIVEEDTIAIDENVLKAGEDSLKNN